LGDQHGMIAVYDVAGVRVMQIPGYRLVQGVNVADLHSGIYLIKVEGNGEVAKFVKE
ncbi:MAG: T9SS type A sorting domain-containing protein, partial [Marinilabiliaceae bacterium]|nr:T9SS type A sorting domain-containing protein [Marinilabiliaceae bacterium]